MIKATMTCTNCKSEKAIPSADLEEAVTLDRSGELNLCSDCSKLWSTEIANFRDRRNEEFAKLQKRFGIKS